MPEPPTFQTVIGEGNIVAGRDVNITNNYAAPQAADRASLLILLGKVKSDWLDGFLKQALHHEISLDVGKTYCPAEVRRPWDEVRETLEPQQEDFVADRSMAESFDLAGRALLILGEPGSGKTIAMLKLAQTLVERAEKDANEPIPTILNLSTWTDKKRGLFDWLAGELSARYYLGRRLAETWLKEGRLALLLDGLDEVQPEHQSGCVLAINAFVQECGVPALVVCSRTGDYRALNQKLNLKGAVLLQPLAIENSSRYLAACGASLSGLVRAMQTDRDLQELASSPLMLRIMAIAYEGRATETLGREGEGSSASRKQDLLDAYIQAAFERKKKLAQPYSKERTLFWLRWLADKSRRHSQMIISLERLQPSWLETKAQICCYLMLSRLAVGILVGVIVHYCFAESSLSYTLTVVIMCTLVGAVDILRFLLSPRPIQTASAGIFYVGGFVVCFTFIFYLLSLFMTPTTFDDLVFNGVTMGTVYGLFFWLRSRTRDLSCDIKPLEVVRWSWSAGWKVAKTWASSAAAVIFVLVSAIGAAYLYDRDSIDTSISKYVLSVAIVGITYGLVGGLTIGVIALLFGGVKPGIREEKGFLHRGIMLTFRNSLRLTGGLSLAFAAFLAGMTIVAALFLKKPLLAALIQSWPLNNLILLDFAIAVWVGCGTIDVLNHYFLRLIAAAMGYMPLRYAHFLNYASKLRLLQKVGGSYLFIHRSMLEHLAAQYPARTDSDSK